MPEFDYLNRYDRMAVKAAHKVISSYSTSFSLATGLLSPSVRRDIRNLYAMVRIADEIVDGPAAAAGLDPEGERAILDELESETLSAIDRGFSSNLIVHAFARTARECGIGEPLIGPFFRSMRTDLQTGRHDAASHDDYVYGSAEVVGLMCLQVFVNAGAPRPTPPEPELVDGHGHFHAVFGPRFFDCEDLSCDIALTEDVAGDSTVVAQLVGNDHNAVQNDAGDPVTDERTSSATWDDSRVRPSYMVRRMVDTCRPGLRWPRISSMFLSSCDRPSRA